MNLPARTGRSRSQKLPLVDQVADRQRLETDPLWLATTPVAIITASGSGIGAACARALATTGFRVSLMSPSDSNIRLADELGGIGRLGSVVDNRDLDGLVESTLVAYGRIDAVVNNMGHGSTAFPPMETLGYDPDFEASPLGPSRLGVEGELRYVCDERDQYGPSGHADHGGTRARVNRQYLLAYCPRTPATLSDERLAISFARVHEALC